MQQLSGIDQIFFALDTATTDAILGGLIRFEAPKDGQPLPDEVFMRHRLVERMDYIPPLKLIRIRTPLGLDHDWIKEADRVDVDKHIHTVHVAAPGTNRELDAELSRIMATPLVQDRPMWDYTIFEGLEDGGVAHLFRVHHGIVDGGLMTQIWTLLSDEPGPLELPDTAVHHPEPLFGRPELIARGVMAFANKPVLMVKMQAITAKWLVQRWGEDGVMTVPALVARMLPGELGKPLANLVNRRQRAVGKQEITTQYPTLLPPNLPINGLMTARRAFVHVNLPFAEAKQIGKAEGATLNAVVVAACAGALRRWLQDKNQLPDKPLVLCAPMSTRDGNETEKWANYIDMIHVPMPTHIEDPVERLHYARTELTKARQSFLANPSIFTRNTSRLVPRDLFHWINEVLVRLPEGFPRTLDNVTVSNVRGPEHINSMNGLPVAGYYPVPFLTPGGGVNLSLWSYRDHLCFGILGCPDKTGDLWPLARYLHEAIIEMHDAVLGTETPSAARADDSQLPPDSNVVKLLG